MTKAKRALIWAACTTPEMKLIYLIWGAKDAYEEIRRLEAQAALKRMGR